MAWCSGPRGMMVLFLKHVHLQKVGAAEDELVCTMTSMMEELWARRRGGKGEGERNRTSRQSKRYKCPYEEHQKRYSRHGRLALMCGG